MNLTSQKLRELRRYLRNARDHLEDVLDGLGDSDREQARRLHSLIRDIASEVAAIDRKITEVDHA